MDLSLDFFAVLLTLTPFLMALVAPAISRETGGAAGWILAIVPAGVFVALFSMVDDVAGGHTQHFAIDWVPSLNLRFGVFIDGLSLAFALLITGIGTLIIIYSARYLQGDPRRGRFLAYMLAFMGAMLGLVLADGLLTLYAFWELTTVTSFLLIGFDVERMEARRAALQALIVTTLGGLSLLAGAVLLHSIGNTWDIAELMPFATQLGVSSVYPWVLGFVLLAAFTKSAQLPFHFWLPNAMEAPTPVSAYLHSATMVQAGIYLLARFFPMLGGTFLWTLLLTIFGGATLLWAGVMALKQTDLKQMLAQTTLASLGLSVLLLGLGTEVAIMGLAAYFIAHALYKAGLFLVTGVIDYGTGTRDITVLGGLRDNLTISFIAAGLAAISMFGLPPFLGFLAKEEIYAGLGFADWPSIVTLAVLVVGNALLGGVALAVLVRPFMGVLKPTPQTPQEGPFGMWLGPALFGLLSFAVVFGIPGYGDTFVAPMASAISGEPVDSHMSLAIDIFGLPFWLSVVTWALAGLIYWRLDQTRGILLELERRFSWSFDKGFDQALFALIRFAGGVTRIFQHGRLELYIGMVFVMLALVLWTPLAAFNGWPALPSFPDLTYYEWAVLALGAIGTITVLLARSRLFAIVALGVQGIAVALVFMLFGAPDLAFTQLMVEVLSVVVLALVMTRLRLDVNDPRPFEDIWRDGVLALVCGVAATALLLRVVQDPFHGRLGEFFAENSVKIAHGRNIVNVILVDFRGLDTLGEISVVMAAGIAVLTLIRRQKKSPESKAARTRRKADA